MNTDIEQLRKRADDLLSESSYTAWGADDVEAAFKLIRDLRNALPGDCAGGVDKDYIISLQKLRIDSLEEYIGLAKELDYDKEQDANLWYHPLMGSLMAVLKEHGHTPMSKDTQICLVKAAINAYEAGKI